MSFIRLRSTSKPMRRLIPRTSYSTCCDVVVEEGLGGNLLRWCICADVSLGMYHGVLFLFQDCVFVYTGILHTCMRVYNYYKIVTWRPRLLNFMLR